MMVIIRANGLRENFKPAKPKPSLEELQRIVGGYIEVCHLPSMKKLIIIDEEGKLKDKPVNRVATLLYQLEHDIDDVIVGDVLICDANLIE